MIARTLLFAMLSACWTGTPAPESPAPRPAPIAATSPAKLPRWKKSPPRPQPAYSPPPGQTPQDVARDLQRELRQNGATALPSYVAGPVVVLDLDAGTVSTVCGASAIAGAQAWGLMLADKSRPEPMCRAGTTYTCTLFSQAQLLIIELADPDAWRIVSVIVGNYRNGRAALHTYMPQLRSLVASATCP